LATDYVKVDGINMRYAREGRGDPLVLIHTLRTQLEYFQKVMPELSKHFEVYALDLPGHGHSDIPHREYTHDFLTKSVEGFLLSLDIREATLIGESIGGVIVLSLASRDTVSLKRVVSLNPYDYGRGGGIRRSSFLAKVVVTAMQWPVIGWIVTHSENKLILRKVLEGGVRDNQALPGNLIDEFHRVGSRKGYRRSERSVFSNWEGWIKARDG